jgi:defect-in-organelle-trafficking protein DotD
MSLNFLWLSRLNGGMTAKRLIAITLVLVLAACTTKRYVVSTNYAIPSVPYLLNADDAEIKLAEAAVSVSRSLNCLAEIEKAAHPCIRLPPPLDAPRFGLACLASLDWIGPVEPLLYRIGEVTHYCIKVLGKEPAIPVIVSITCKNTPFADILRNISLQIHKKACIVIYPNSRVIELRYMTF